MPLAHRVIPTILCDGHLQVKGQRFQGGRRVGAVAQAMRVHAMRGVDEVVLFDTTATRQGREPNYDLVRKITERCFFPLTVGGGVSKLDHIDKLLRAGADKVSIHSHPELITPASERFGKQAIVAVIDHYFTQMWHGLEKGDAMMAEEMGAGEIILQCMDRDGTMEGYNLETIESVAKAVSIPVVASGGCSGYEDMHRALEAGADATAAGALFQFQDCTPQGAAEYLHSKGWEVRNERRTG